jgi:DNA polymerase III sliding clamp (beta) subunit (PCNA family)
MEIYKKVKLEKAVSTDILRTNQHNIHISKRQAMATNGHILAIVPVQSAKGDTDGWLSPDALKLARKVAPKSADPISIGLNGSQVLPDGTQMTRPGNDEQPPEVSGILHSAQANRKFKIGINATLLKDLADALGEELVVLEVGTPESAILVRPIHSKDGERGLIMPVRLNP